MQFALAELVTKRLEETNASQSQLARDIGYTPAMVNSWLHGKQKAGEMFLFKIQKWLENGGVDPKEDERRSIVALLKTHGITNPTELYNKILKKHGYSYSSAKLVYSKTQKGYVGSKVYDTIRSTLTVSKETIQKVEEEIDRMVQDFREETKAEPETPYAIPTPDYTTFLEWLIENPVEDTKEWRNDLMRTVKTILGET